jgi:hypothetical protein
MKKYVYRLTFIAEDKIEADQMFEEGQEPYDMENKREEITDDDLELLWEALGDVPVNDDGEIEVSFLKWREGTDREKIWKWFDEEHSEGVASLMSLE